MVGFWFGTIPKTNRQTLNKVSSNMSSIRGKRLARILAPTFTLLVPFIGYLRYHDYPLWKSEILVAVALLLGVGISLGLLWSSWGVKSRAIISALLLILAIDTLLGIEWITAVKAWGGVTVLFAILLAGMAIVVTVCWLLRQHLEVIIAVVMGTVLGGTLLLPVRTIPIGEFQEPHNKPDLSLPPVVHLILDEQIGIEGLPVDIPGAAELGESLKEFYGKSHFTLFGGTYSLFFDTKDSLSTLVNGSVTSNVEAFVSGSGNRSRIRDNAWFRQLLEAGYRIRVYQNDYLDFCKTKNAEVDYCFTYPGNSIKSLEDSEISFNNKLKLLFARFINKSLAYRVVISALRSQLSISKNVFATGEVWLGGLSSLSIFERIASDMRVEARGTAFFAHLLLPHSSYFFNRDCSIRHDSETWLRNFDPLQPLWGNTSESRRERYALYIDQVRCTHRALEKLFTDMKALGIFDGALIIVHGDHGSRIAINSPMLENKDLLTDTDLKDNYSTLMAVHAQGLEAGYSLEKRSIQDLFADIIMDSSIEAENNNVFLRRGNRTDEEELLSIPMAW